jgi:hypothetical protein
MSEQPTVQQIEVTMEHCRKAIKDGEMLDRLMANKDFKEFFIEGYFKEEAARLVAFKARPELQSENTQKAIDRDISAIGVLQEHFNSVRQMAEQARITLEQGQAALDELEEEAGEV